MKTVAKNEASRPNVIVADAALVTKTEAIRRAIKAGHGGTSASAIAYVKKNFNLEVSKKFFYAVKSQIKLKKPDGELNPVAPPSPMQKWRFPPDQRRRLARSVLVIPATPVVDTTVIQIELVKSMKKIIESHGIVNVRKAMAIFE